MKNLLFVSFAFVFFSFFNSVNVFACTCEVRMVGQKFSIEDKVERAFKESSAIFVGKIVSFRDVKQYAAKERTYYVLSRRAKIKVEKMWKGKLSRFIELETGLGGGDCGYKFVVGEKYLIYAYGKQSDSLRTNICTRTELVSESSADIEILNKIKASNKTNSTSPK